MNISSTGWWGIPGQKEGKQKVHAVIDGKPICGQKLHPDAQFQWCAHGLHWDYLECGKCKAVIKRDYENTQRSSGSKPSRMDSAVATNRPNVNPRRLRKDRRSSVHPARKVEPSSAGVCPGGPGAEPHAPAAQTGRLKTMTKHDALEELERVADNLARIEQEVSRLRRRTVASIKSIRVADAEELEDRRGDAFDRDAHR